jgi:hypothetical protein
MATEVVSTREVHNLWIWNSLSIADMQGREPCQYRKLLNHNDKLEEKRTRIYSKQLSSNLKNAGVFS